MTDLFLEKVTTDMFKGERHAEYEFSQNTLIKGANGSGKTTVLDAITWVFTDKDYNLRSNPEVRNDQVEEGETSVTIQCRLDGTPLEIRKYQKDVRTKKQIEAGAPVRISNMYEINSVPKNQKDFISYLEDAGLDLDKFLLLVHPEIFTGQKSADCRSILFGMVTDVTDKEIAELMPDCKELAEMLETYTADEITAMMKRQEKQAKEQIDAIPNQIIGLEKGKVDIDVSEFEAQRETLQAEITELEEQILAYRKESPEALNKELVLLDKEYQAMVATANSERISKLTEANTVIGNKRVELNRMIAEQDTHTKSLDAAIRIGNELSARYKQLADEFQSWKSKEFDPSSAKCPYCGQDLPILEIDKLHKKFELDKKTRMDAINIEAKDIQKKATNTKKLVITTQGIIQDHDAKINAMREEIEKLSQERTKLETVISVDGTPEGQEVLRKIAEIHHRLNQRDSYKEQECSMLASLRDMKSALQEIDETIGSVKVNDHINQQIAELKARQKQHAQSRADANRILDQLSILSMKKNSLMEEQVNSHFTRVKFRLFYTQKNGEVRDDCTPLVLTNDGEYRDITFSANTAAIVLAQLDIINGLQEFYGQHLPVLLDGAECLDEESFKEAASVVKTQFIATFVTEGKLEVEAA